MPGLLRFSSRRALRGEWGGKCFRQKIYIGQIAVVVFGVVITSTWGATRWTASALGYQNGLGSPWLTLSGYPIYLPWRLFEWWYAYEAYAPEIFERAGAIVGDCIQHIRSIESVRPVWDGGRARLIFPRDRGASAQLGPTEHSPQKPRCRGPPQHALGWFE
jgi:hypothetical protein